MKINKCFWSACLIRNAISKKNHSNIALKMESPNNARPSGMTITFVKDP